MKWEHKYSQGGKGREIKYDHQENTYNSKWMDLPLPTLCALLTTWNLEIMLIFYEVLPVIDNHLLSRFGLQNHLKMLRGKIPIEIKGEKTNLAKTEEISSHNTNPQ